MKHSIAFTKSLLHYVKPEGTCVEERSLPYHEWVESRRKTDIWSYSRVLMTKVAHRCTLSNEYGEGAAKCLNFGSQDYLGLAQSEALRMAAREAIDEFGVHSAGSPVLSGRTRLLLELEERLRRILGREECIVFPTGWAAGFSSIAGLARPDDVVLMDMLSHNCLQEGARHATTHVYKFAHNNLDDLEKHLRQERDKNAQNGIFVVLESLYSMDSDSPNLEGAIRLAHEYNAITILDVAHDFGAIGERGLGLLETVQFGEVPDLIMGSFSKTFAANGGFIACSRRVRDYLQYFASPHIFSNAISPIQTAVVNRAFDIIFSAEGATLRSRLSKNIRHLREAMEGHGLTVAGIPSPIVPVFVGDEKLARLTARYLEQNGLLANLVEFPAVARGKARFRFQVMATHEDDAFEYAGEAMARSKAQATRQWEEIETASH